MKPLITMIVPYYRQPEMLRRQLLTWIDYAQEVREAFRFIVVDDGSPNAAEGVFAVFGHPPGFSLYRIDQDVPWNRSMARNLGTLEATTPWVLHVDTDHVLPPESAAWLARNVVCGAPLRREHWYRFGRFRVGAADETRKKDKISPNATFAKIHPHIDSYLCTKESYWGAGGYNEDFSGVLGGGSPFLKEMVRANGEPALLDDCPLHVYTRSVVKDSSEHTLSRDPKLFMQRKREIIAKHGTLKGRGVKAALRLPWHKVF